MAILTTTRLAIKRWESGADAFTRSDMDESHAQLEARVAGFDNGGSQPTAGAAKAGFFHYTTTDASVGQLSYCNGNTYFDIAAPGTISSLDGTLSDGTATTVARSDHTHSLDDSVVTTAKLNDSAVTTAKIGANAVTNAKLGGDLNASKLTAGTLPIARIADGDIVTAKLNDGAVTNAKLAATGLDATKLTTGTLDVARITDGAVTNAKLADMGANTVKIRQSSTGVPQNVEIGTNSVLGRTTGALQSMQVQTNMIANDQVTYAKMQNISSGYSILGKAGTGSGNVAEITAGTDSVLRRDGSGNLGFGKIDGNHITSNSITATQINAGAVGSSELADNAVDNAAIQDSAVTGAKILNNTITLGTKTSGNYVATVSGGTSIDVSGTGEGAGVTVSHANTSNLNGFYGGNNNALVIEDITVDANGHVTGIGTRDMDDYFARKTDTYTDGTGGGYRVTYGTGNPSNGDGAPNGSIYLQHVS